MAWVIQERMTGYKKRPADLSIIKRLGRFYWRKDNENILNGKEILKSGNNVTYFQISSLSQPDGKPIAAVSILG